MIRNRQSSSRKSLAPIPTAICCNCGLIQRVRKDGVCYKHKCVPNSVEIVQTDPSDGQEASQEHILQNVDNGYIEGDVIMISTAVASLNQWTTKKD